MLRHELIVDMPQILSREVVQSLRLLERPVPREIRSREGWKDIPVVEPEKPERMVAIGPFSDYPDIYTSSIYYGEHTNSPYAEKAFPESMISLHVRESVADQLRLAQSFLPDDMFLIGLDAYRPIALQKRLYDSYFADLKMKNPTWSDEDLSTETQKFVSLPMNTSIDPETSFISPHNTGGAIDLAIIKLPPEIAEEVRAIDAETTRLIGDTAMWKRDYELQMRKMQLIHENGVTLNFGTDMDQSGRESALNYFEVLEQQRKLTPAEKEAQTSRRILYNAMILAGFEGFADEWWHYNSKKTQMGAIQSGRKVAEFGEGRLLESHEEHEHMRIHHRAGTITLFYGRQYDPEDDLREEFDAAQQAAFALGDYRDARYAIPQTNRLPRAVIIRP